MKKTTLLLIFLHFIVYVQGQNSKLNIPLYSSYFHEIKAATNDHIQLWNIDLYSSILLVDPKTRHIIANDRDSAGILEKKDDIFTGYLPDNVNIANTIIRWSGKDWAMMMLPLPQDKRDRINLLSHELFHLAQPSLGFSLHNPDNNHLDTRSGRTYLRLELEALIKAVASSNKSQMKEHLNNAFLFRKYRYQLHPGSEVTENLLELNEGLAEYTGFIFREQSGKDAAEHFTNSINSFLNNKTFVRSFAYQTISIYGYLLRDLNKYWNKEMNTNSNLTTYFIDAFGIKLPENLEAATAKVLDNYNGNKIIAEEIAREEQSKKVLAEYKKRFIEDPHFDIYFEQMNISFDPGNIIPLEDKGNVYPNIRVTDNWGILEVENGALLSSGGNKITITNPENIEGNKITGDGWTLQLKDDYILKKEDASDNYILIKK